MLVCLYSSQVYFPASNVGRACVEKQAPARSNAAADCHTGSKIAAGMAIGETWAADNAWPSMK
jgi:hypothetical protein